MVSPEDAGIGDAPANAANAASDLNPRVGLLVVGSGGV